MTEDIDQPELTQLRASTLQRMHTVLLESLRHREQEILRFYAVIGSAVGAFILLLQSDVSDAVFALASISILLVLLHSAYYSLALGYNYRYITLALAKLEAVLGIGDFMLLNWPRSRDDFLDRYKFSCGIPWCTPPEIIKVFWVASIVGIVMVTITAFLYRPGALYSWSILAVGTCAVLLAFVMPTRFGKKLRALCRGEPQSWIAMPDLEATEVGSDRPGT